MVKSRVIRIYNVSTKQQKLLDILWEFETREAMTAWMETLSYKKYKKVFVLKQLIELAVIDEFVNKMKEFPHAQAIIDAIIDN